MKNLHHFLYKTAIVWKIALASGLSWEIAKLAGSKHPYLAPLSVILCLQITVGKSIHYGLQRVLGTIAGVLITAYLTPYIGINAWSLGLLLLIATAIIHGLGFNKIVINQVALSILLVLSFESHSSYGFDRIRDTLIGCVLAVLINMFMLPPDFTEKASKAFKNYAEELIKGFQQTGEWLENQWQQGDNSELKATIERLWKDLTQTMTQFEQAEQSLQHHPFTKKSHQKLHKIQTSLHELNSGFMHLINIHETLSEWHKKETITSEERHFWAKRLTSIAHYLQNYQKEIENKQLTQQVPKQTTISETKTIDTWAANLLLPKSIAAYRFAYALQNDTIETLIKAQKL